VLIDVTKALEYLDEGLTDLDHIECEEDIHAHFKAHEGNAQGLARTTCSWCDTEHRGTLPSTLAWFHEHPCSTQYADAAFAARLDKNIAENASVLGRLAA
jgi:hypothetical protein